MAGDKIKSISISIVQCLLYDYFHQDDDGDDDAGYMVPLNEHPATSKTNQKPPLYSEIPVKSRNSKQPPDKYDKESYQVSTGFFVTQ